MNIRREAMFKRWTKIENAKAECRSLGLIVYEDHESYFLARPKLPERRSGFVSKRERAAFARKTKAVAVLFEILKLTNDWNLS